MKKLLIIFCLILIPASGWGVTDLEVLNIPLYSTDFGTGSGNVCEGDDSRLSDTRTPTDSSVTSDKFSAATLVTEAEGAASSDNDTSFPTVACLINEIANAVSSFITSTGVTKENLDTNGDVVDVASTLASNDSDDMLVTAGAIIDYSAKAGDAWQGDSTLSTNQSYYGCVVSVTAGETLAFGDVLYQKKSDHEWYEAVETTTNTQIVEAYCLGAGTDGNSVNVLLEGYVRDDSYDWTIDDTLTLLWKSTSAGTITETVPTTSDNWAGVIGTIQTADILYFNPQILQIKVP